jgi:hypothetical protein
VAILFRAPTSDEAASGTWSGSAGSRYALVDDYPDASGADYLSHGTTAGDITFGFAPFGLLAGSTIASVQVQYYDAEPSAGTNNLAGRLKVGGSYYNASTHNPSGTTYTSRTDTWATNPKSGASWTVDDVNGVGANALQAFGLYSGDANPAVRISSIRVVVNYTPPTVSFPATPILDDFNRADEGSVGPPVVQMTGWRDMSGQGVIGVRNNQAAGLVGGTGGAAANHSGWDQVFGSEQEAYVTVAVKPLNSEEINLYLRVDEGLQGYCYGYIYYREGTSDKHYIMRIDSVSATQISPTVYQTIGIGDKLGFRALGNEFTVYRLPSGSSTWQVLVGPITDSTYTHRGYISLDHNSDTIRTDDFGGGTIIDGGGAATPISASDTATLSLAEVPTLAVTVAPSDTLTVATAEAQSLTVAVAPSDTATVSVTEATALTAGLTATDTATVGTAEAVTLGVSLSPADTLAVGLAESPSLSVSLSLAETLGISLSDLASLGGEYLLTSVDTLGISASEAASLAVGVAPADTLGVSLTGATGLSATLALAETLGVSVGEAAGIAALATLTASDALGVRVGESATTQIVTALTTSDALGLALVEATTLAVSVAVADALSAGLSDGVALAGTLAVSDPLGLSVADVAAVTAVWTLADALGLSVAEAAAVATTVLTTAVRLSVRPRDLTLTTPARDLSLGTRPRDLTLEVRR